MKKIKKVLCLGSGIKPFYESKRYPNAEVILFDFLNLEQFKINKSGGKVISGDYVYYNNKPNYFIVYNFLSESTGDIFCELKEKRNKYLKVTNKVKITKYTWLNDLLKSHIDNRSLLIVDIPELVSEIDASFFKLCHDLSLSKIELNISYIAGCEVEKFEKSYCTYYSDSPVEFYNDSSFLSLSLRSDVNNLLGCSNKIHKILDFINKDAFSRDWLNKYLLDSDISNFPDETENAAIDYSGIELYLDFFNSLLKSIKKDRDEKLKYLKNRKAQIADLESKVSELEYLISEEGKIKNISYLHYQLAEYKTLLKSYDKSYKEMKLELERLNNAFLE